MNTCIAMLILSVVWAHSQNLLHNPGFESWNSGMPEYWSADDSIIVFQEPGIIHGGIYSAKESLCTQAQTLADLYQGRLAVQPNTEYTFTIWVYDSDPAGRIRHGIDWYPTGSSWYSQYSTDTLGWQELILHARSPADAESAMVQIRAYDSAATWDGGAIFYVDDASFSAVPDQPPVIVRVWHMPVNPDGNSTVDVYAKVTDDGSISFDTLFYGINNLVTPSTITHTAVSHDTFRYAVPGHGEGDTVLYYHRFIDNDGHSTYSDTYAYYVGAIELVINEVLYDVPGTDSACFLELFGTGGMMLDGISVVGVNGMNGSDYATIDLSGHVLPQDGFFVIAQDITVTNADTVTQEINLQNGPDNVELRFNGITVDALGYGTLGGWYFTGEWSPAADVAAAHCLGRYPDGYDSDHNVIDFHDYTIQTPGEGNPVVVSMDASEDTPVCRMQPNPVTKGSMVGSVVGASAVFPITIYNTLGQVVLQVDTPSARLMLVPGIYFLKTHDYAHLVKIVVVD